MGLPSVQAASTSDPYEIVSRCGSKNPGIDQRSRLTITLLDSEGNKRKSVYLRLWKDYTGSRKLSEKMVLFTEYPPEARGTAFMRWAYHGNSAQNAQQWIYLPVLKKIRRVTVRDLNESFLGSDLTFGDITPREVRQDRHQFVKLHKGRNRNQFYIIKSVPQEKNSQYGYKVNIFLKAANWDECRLVRTDYYDRRNELLKRQFLKWQHVKDAWVWSKVQVENVQTVHTSIFEVDNVEVDVGLGDNVFTERTLKLTYK